jgi:hypothetical protein
VTKNYVELFSGKQISDLSSVAVLQLNPFRDSSFPRGAPGEIQHLQRRIETRDVKAKSRQPHGHSAGAAPEIQSAQSRHRLREKLPQVGEGKIQAQSAFGCLQIGGVFICALEAFAFDGHFVFMLHFSEAGRLLRK